MSQRERRPKVFISYSWADGQHDHVRLLANKLNALGLDCDIDQFHTCPPEGWQLWMMRSVEKSDFVLIVCGRKYCTSVTEGRPGVGLGVQWEFKIICNLLHSQGASKPKDRVIPLVFDGEPAEVIPLALRDHSIFFPLRSGEQLQALRDYLFKVHGGTVERAAGNASPGVRRSKKYDRFARWNVPFQRNRHFVGRTAELERIHAVRDGGTNAALAVIHGIPGVGKTQMAVEYAYQHRRHFSSGVFLIRADRDESLRDSLVRMAQTVIPESVRDMDDQENVIAAAREWLATNERWLLLCDNVLDQRLLADITRAPCGSQIVATSQHTNFDSLPVSETIQLGELDLDDACTLLRRRSGRPLRSSKERHAAEELVNELGRLPLAIDQAARLIQQFPLTISGFLARYRQRMTELDAAE